MAELADALDSGSSGRKAVQVQVLLSAPNAHNPNHERQVIPVGEGFGFVLYLKKYKTIKGYPIKGIPFLFTSLTTRSTSYTIILRSKLWRWLFEGT